MTYDTVLAQMKIWIQNLAINTREATVILEEIDGQDISTEDFAEHLEMFGYPNLAAEITGAPVNEGWYLDQELTEAE